MSDLDAYFKQYFLNAEQLATASQLSVDQIFTLIQEQLLPAPSYIVSNSAAVKSYVFGEMPAPGATNGEYFHPANIVWAKNAQRLIAAVGREQAPESFKNCFEEDLKCALSDLNTSMWRLRDSFDDEGSLIPDGLHSRFQSIWEHFLRGTFGLCVANPISVEMIARKEVLQEKLSALSENGAKTTFLEAEAQAIIKVIDAYALSAMPFSPIEYSVSSRKRLVEDLRIRIAAHHG